MAAKQSMGIRHVTVVPTNFESGNESDGEPDEDDGARES